MLLCTPATSCPTSILRRIPCFCPDTCRCCPSATSSRWTTNSHGPDGTKHDPGTEPSVSGTERPQRRREPIRRPALQLATDLTTPKGMSCRISCKSMLATASIFHVLLLTRFTVLRYYGITIVHFNLVSEVSIISLVSQREV